MKKLFLLATLLLATPALAQQQASEVTLKITSDDVNVIGRALGKLPFDEVAPLIQKLRQQIVEQQQKAQEPAKIEAPEVQK